MFRAKTHRSAAFLIAGFACLTVLPPQVRGAEPIKLSGAITGMVANSAGTPQAGASVILYNRQDRVYEKALTDDRGEFRFLGLFPDVYSLRVTLASFIPAIKRNILVQPGMRSVMAVNLNSLFSSIQLAYPPVENGSLMTDDWKWMLRTASATRPVLRFAGDDLAKTSNSSRETVFSDTRGVVQLSAGDGPLVTGVGSEADLGTAFALATSLFGNNMLEVSGNLGYGSQTGIPVAAFRTTYSRNTYGSSPEFSVTMRQLLLPGGNGSENALPTLRSVSASFDDRAQLSDNLSLQYGFTLDSVSFVEHLNSFSPYARLVYSLGDNGEVALAYTSGNARPDLAGGSVQESDLQRDLNTLGLFPRLSLLAGRPKMQRGEEYELSYSRRLGSRQVQLSAYQESVTNAALNVLASDDVLGGDLLPDMFGNNSVFNAGNYRSTGYTASLTQNLGERFSATMMYGTMGSLTVDKSELATGSADELRSIIRAGRQRAATARIAATVPGSGTQLIASYQWTPDRRAVMPGRLYSTQSMRPLPGMNVYVRQPIPGLSLLPWRVEATADLRNLLAQGYLPLTAANGQPLVLVQMPRSFRGGLSFIF